MVTSTTSVPYTYLGTLAGGKAAAPAPAATPPTTSTTAASTTTATDATNPSSVVSSLLGGGTKGFSSQILSLLQQDSSGSFDPIKTLLGGTGTNDALTSQFANLFASSVASSLTQAKNNSPQAIAASNPVQSLLDGISKASIAYNKTNLQNSQNIVNANSYGADGVTSLVA